MQVVLNQMKSSDLSTSSVSINSHLLSIFMSLLSENLQDTTKRNLLEFLKSALGLESMVYFLSDKPSLADEIIKTIFDLGEPQGSRLIKGFNNFICTNWDKLTHDIEISLMRNYYAKVGEFLHNLNHELAKGASSMLAAGNTPPAHFKDSIILHEEMFAHLRIVGDRRPYRPEAQKEFVSLITKYFRFLVGVNLKELRKNLNETQYTNLLQLVCKIIALFTVIIIKKDANNRSEFSRNIAAEFDRDPDNIPRLMQVTLDFFGNIPPALTKLKVDAFSHIRAFAEHQSKVLLPHFDKLLADEFFTNKIKIRFSETEINRIYFYWISAQKLLIRHCKADLTRELSLETILQFIENNIHILYENYIYPNYLLNIMHNVGSLCEIMREKLTNELRGVGNAGITVDLNKIAKCIFQLVQKLVGYLKQSCHSIKELSDYLSKDGNKPKVGKFENFAFLGENEVIEHIKKHGQEIETEELILKGEFSSRFATDVLIQHSFNFASDKSYKFEGFVEDSIVKKMMLLNEIICKFLVEYFRVSLLASNGPSASANANGPPSVKNSRVVAELQQNKSSFYYLQNLTFQEKDLLRKIFSLNLKIFNLLICNANHFEYVKIHEQIRFPILDFFCYRNCYTPADNLATARTLQVRFRDIYSLFQSLEEDLILMFVDIYLSSPDNYTNNYTLFIDSFSGSAVIDSIQKGEPEQVQTARQTIHAFNEVVILKLIELMQKKQIEYFEPIAQKIQPKEVRTYAVRILKGIFRKIKYRELPNNQPRTDFMDIKDATFNLILVIMEKTYTEPNLMNYLHLLRNIFSVGSKFPEFTNYLTEKMYMSGVRFIGFLFSLFSTNYQELRIMAVELIVFVPLSPQRMFKNEIKRPNDLRRYFDMLDVAIDFNEASVVSRALQLLEIAIGTLDWTELRVILNDRISSIYSKLAGLLGSRSSQFSILRKNSTQDMFKQRYVCKIMGRLAEYLMDARELETFEVKRPIGKLEELVLDIGGARSAFGDSLPGGPNGCQIDLREYIEVLYKELHRLKEKPWFNNFYSISFNYMYFCTVKHKRGLEKLFEFLSQLLNQLYNRTFRDPGSPDGMLLEVDTPETCLFSTGRSSVCSTSCS